MDVVVDDFDQHGQIGGQLDQALGMNDAARAKSSGAVYDGRSRKTLRSKTLEERTPQRLMPPSVRFSQIDPNHRLFAIEYSHRILSTGHTVANRRSAAHPQKSSPSWRRRSGGP